MLKMLDKESRVSSTGNPLKTVTVPPGSPTTVATPEVGGLRR